MALDVAMGGSTNTVLHILAAAQEGEIDFDLAAIDAVSRRVPCLSKVSPNSDYHMEDVHRAGGIPAILGELWRGGLLNEGVRTVHSPSLEAWLGEWDIRAEAPSETAVELFHAAPGGVRTTEAFSTENRWSSLDTDAAGGCIRDVAHAYTADGGLAVLRGNIAPDGAVIKTAGIPEELWHFAGPARVVESQEEAVSVILTKQVQPGDVIVVRYEGPSGGPGMQEMLHPTAFLKGAGLGRVCALITDGRFSGGSSGISVGHISPEAAAGGVIGLIENGDRVVIDVASRTLALDVPEEVLAERRAKMDASERPWQPRDRDRPVSKALRAYAALATSAHTGAVRRVPEAAPSACGDVMERLPQRGRSRKNTSSPAATPMIRNSTPHGAGRRFQVRPSLQGDPACAGQHQRGGAEPEHDLQLDGTRPGRPGDEEPVDRLEQHRVDHQAQQAGGGQRREDAEDDRRTAHQLRQRRHPHQDVHVPEPESGQRVAQPGQADAAPQPEHVLHAVREDHPADGEPQQDQAEVGAAAPGQLAALRAVQRLGGRATEAGSRRGADRPDPDPLSNNEVGWSLMVLPSPA